MNAISDFFTKHGAVPAGERGIDWKTASDTALLFWAENDCRTWDEFEDSRRNIRSRLQQIHDELVTRTTGANAARLAQWTVRGAVRLGVKS
jgi:hypothetical protein